MSKINHATKLLNVILDNKYSQFKESKKIINILNSKLQEIENEINSEPEQDLDVLQQTVEDEISGETLKEQIENSIKLLKEEDYKAYFKNMLDKWNIKSPAELSKEDQKKFFDAVSKGWKGKKESN